MVSNHKVNCAEHQSGCTQLKGHVVKDVGLATLNKKN